MDVEQPTMHFLNCLHVACITDRTFYFHQRQYLEPSVQAVWNHKQQQLSSACELPLIIGGDGRTDSPGHSAKYGSYGVIDLRTNEVLHIELVQVNYTIYKCLKHEKISIAHRAMR